MLPHLSEDYEYPYVISQKKSGFFIEWFPDSFFGPCTTWRNCNVDTSAYSYAC